MKHNGLAFKDFFSGLAGEFGEHIDHSIPGYSLNRERTANAITRTFNGRAVTLDVGASEGQLGNRLSQLSALNLTENVDTNPDMLRAWRPHSVLAESYRIGAWVDGFQDGDNYIPAYTSEHLFDVVHMSMVRQFVTDDAHRWYAEAVRFLRPHGLFIVNVKTIASPGDEAGWKAREAAKDAYKLQYFTQEQIDAKAEETLVGMHQLMLTDEQEREALRASFRYVATYWESFNFRGYVASNCEASVRRFLQEY